MRRALFPPVVAGCLLLLTLACFGPVLFRGRQFSYRDAGNFYYPLYLRVQQEWGAGRWPLWLPEENGGTPLLGNPSAAVFYPGKVLYALPYAWGARLYVIAHVLLAFANMLALLRHWRVSWTGSALGGMAYAFGAPVLFQYCNVIFLVGAAWSPLGLLAMDRLVRLEKSRAAVELAAVLALQTLGGDPESAYVLVLCGGLYALVLGRLRGASPGPRGRPPSGGRNAVAVWAGLFFTGAAWLAGTLAFAAWRWSQRARLGSRAGLPQLTSPSVLLVAWFALAALYWLLRRKRPEGRASLRAGAALLIASALGLGLGAVQVLPALEFSRLSGRSGASRHNLYHFSVEPYRALEGLWPAFFGTDVRRNHHWLPLVPPSHSVALWVPSCYLGGLTLLLFLSALGLRAGPPWRGWLSAIAVLGALCAIGEFGSPLWWVRSIPAMASTFGPHDPPIHAPARSDGGSSDGIGSLYWLLSVTLPGFGAFRYPGKFLTIASLAVAGLAGLGWDRWAEGESRLGRILSGWLLAASLIALLVASTCRDRLLRVGTPEQERRVTNYLGPFDRRGALDGVRRSLVHGAVVMTAGLLLATGARRRSGIGLVALGVLAIDLAAANASLIATVPQSIFDEPSTLARLIDEAERREPSRGPFRIHRMPSWTPPGWWSSTEDPGRVQRVARWEHDTLSIKHAIAQGLSSTLARNTIEHDDYLFLFSSFPLAYDASRVALPGARDGQAIAYHPRRAYDLWNTRYFILPMHPNGWEDDQRGFASFLADTDLIAPARKLFDDPRDRKSAARWMVFEDWQLRRNRSAYPRAWVVHQARRVEPRSGRRGQAQVAAIHEMLYADDPFWFDGTRQVFDPTSIAWLETDDIRALRPFLPGPGPAAGETVVVRRYEPQRVELEAHLERPGIVILADLYYPGWAVSIDGVPSTILRANALMRGTPVRAGTHRLVYTYKPLSFRIGGLISIATLGLCVPLWLCLGRVTAKPGGASGKSQASSVQ